MVLVDISASAFSSSPSSSLLPPSLPLRLFPSRHRISLQGMALILGTGHVVPRPVASRPASSHAVPPRPHPSRSISFFVSAHSKRTLGRSRTTGGGTVFAPPSCYLLPCRTLAVSFPPLPQILILQREAIPMPTRGGGTVFAPPKRSQARPPPADHTPNINIGGRGGGK